MTSFLPKREKRYHFSVGLGIRIGLGLWYDLRYWLGFGIGFGLGSGSEIKAQAGIKVISRDCSLASDLVKMEKLLLIVASSNFLQYFRNTRFYFFHKSHILAQVILALLNV